MAPPWQIGAAALAASAAAPLPAQKAAFATRPEASRGRLHGETECPTRGPFQRDRDRILHSTAFRRLTYKTQVFIAHEGDHYRTRLTHTLEVAQIARTMARQLQLDEDLAEALALAHDLGHPPFGHAGERALDRAMSQFGGFDHNAQSLKVVTELERKYAAFDGLNLTWETLEGLVKHNGPLTGRRASTPLARAKLPAVIRAYDDRHRLQLTHFASAEAQLAALADDIAYNNHDIDDGLRAGLIEIDDLREVPLTCRFVAEVEEAYGSLAEPRVIYEVNRRMITAMVADVVGETRARLAALAPRSVADVRAADRPAAAFSARMAVEIATLQAFLFTSVYRHKKVMRVMRGAEAVVEDLFARYMKSPADLPGNRAETGAVKGEEGARVLHIADFVAGMTDRYAIEEHRRLFDATPDLR